MEVNGVVAQQLRFLDLLLDDPLQVRVEERAESEKFGGVVQVPRAGLFVLQKALTFRRRKERAKSDKDLFYVFDLADQSRKLLSTIGEDIERWKAKDTRDWPSQAADLLEEYCGSPDADSIGRVLQQIPVEQRPPRRYVSDTFGELIRILRTGTDQKH